MTATDLEHSDAHQYFRSIEERFIDLRGAPLLLSSSDWQTARRWHARGIPLDLVLRSIEEVFRGREDAPARKRPLDLRYCAKAVENAWETVRELTAAAVGGAREPTALAVRPRLEALAEALPASLEERDIWRERILALEGSSKEIEAKLEKLDAQLLAAVEVSLEPARRKRIDAQVEISLEVVAARLDSSEAERARERLARRVLRQELSLPILSLFAPDLDGL